MDQWGVIRLRCPRDREPIIRVARELGLVPNSVRKYVRTQAVPQKMRIELARRPYPFQAIMI
jgi:ABC-type antimicrobial peptide transport system ATPase subunit